jgi:hypothetical protein
MANFRINENEMAATSVVDPKLFNTDPDPTLQ